MKLWEQLICAIFCCWQLETICNIYLQRKTTVEVCVDFLRNDQRPSITIALRSFEKNKNELIEELGQNPSKFFELAKHLKNLPRCNLQKLVDESCAQNECDLTPRIRVSNNFVYFTCFESDNVSNDITYEFISSALIPVISWKVLRKELKSNLQICLFIESPSQSSVSNSQCVLLPVQLYKVDLIYSVKEFQLLPKPYSSDCKDYSKSKIKSRRECIDKCLLNLTLKHCKRLPPLIALSAEDSQPLRRVNEHAKCYENLTTICYSRCKIDCVFRFYKIILKELGGSDQLRFNVLPSFNQLKTVFKLSPLLSKLDFFTYICSTLNFWLSISIFQTYLLLEEWSPRFYAKIMRTFQRRLFTYRDDHCRQKMKLCLRIACFTACLICACFQTIQLLKAYSDSDTIVDISIKRNEYFSLPSITFQNYIFYNLNYSKFCNENSRYCINQTVLQRSQIAYELLLRRGHQFAKSFMNSYDLLSKCKLYFVGKRIRNCSELMQKRQSFEGVYLMWTLFAKNKKQSFRLEEDSDVLLEIEVDFPAVTRMILHENAFISFFNSPDLGLKYEMKKVKYVATYETISFALLPTPYSTRCKNYTSCNSRIECMNECILQESKSTCVVKLTSRKVCPQYLTRMNFIIPFFVLSFIHFDVISANCLAHWHQMSNKCYHLNSTLANVYENYKYCQRLNASMISLDSNEEFEFLASLLDSQSFYWLDGIQLAYKNQSFVWSIGEEFDYLEKISDKLQFFENFSCVSLAMSKSKIHKQTCKAKNRQLCQQNRNSKQVENFVYGPQYLVLVEKAMENSWSTILAKIFSLNNTVSELNNSISFEIVKLTQNASKLRHLFEYDLQEIKIISQNMIQNISNEIKTLKRKVETELDSIIALNENMKPILHILRENSDKIKNMSANFTEANNFISNTCRELQVRVNKAESKMKSKSEWINKSINHILANLTDHANTIEKLRKFVNKSIAENAKAIKSVERKSNSQYYRKFVHSKLVIVFTEIVFELTGRDYNVTVKLGSSFTPQYGKIQATVYNRTTKISFNFTSTYQKLQPGRSFSARVSLPLEIHNIRKTSVTWIRQPSPSPISSPKITINRIILVPTYIPNPRTRAANTKQLCPSWFSKSIRPFEQLVLEKRC
ncbi:hypothetical protein B4U79_19004 [Dinothrombium tinctorium]|uniref:C-type lectin domain-containing protein n=1 Tax=Dinothrombium tinctorium TaxID=1965070 RepID=A0A3S3PXR8_9ACAR|nr:hypothetical protein B4U79_19004 [Dinothrombium tinctorium]